MTKTVLFLVLLVAAAVGVALILGGNGKDALPGATQPAAVQTKKDPEPGERITALKSGEPTKREQVERAPVVVDPAGQEEEQGVVGRLVGPNGVPVADTDVYLMGSGGLDMIRQMVMARDGKRFPPIARTKTDAQGTFALGVQTIKPNEIYEIRVVTEDFVDKKVPNVTITVGNWYDLGDIGLALGQTIHGVVTVEGGAGMPVPDAKVMLRPANSMPAMSPTPGREDGLVAMTDSTGAFRLENAPHGVVNISAVAAGFARVDKFNTTIEQQAPTEVNFELPRGLSIAGEIVDQAGEAVTSARIEAQSLNAKMPARSDSNSTETGGFEVIGLRNGDYVVTVTAPGYERATKRPVSAGDSAVQIVLERQGSAKVRVYNKTGSVLQRYRITIKQHFENQEHYGNTQIPVQQSRPDANGYSTVTGINKGSYVFQIEAPGHCKSFSDPFAVSSTQTPEVEVRLTEGGSIEGLVTDAGGKPLKGVDVITLPNHLDENPFTQMFGSLIPYKISRTGTKTNDKGRFRLALLTPGTYQVKFSCPDFSEAHLKNVEVAVGQATQMQPTRLDAGTLVSGKVSVDGKPTGQVKVTLSVVPDAEGQVTSMFHVETISMPDGSFVFPKRVPPGNYRAMAQPHAGENPLMAIIYAQKTQQEFSLGLGQKQYFLNFAISSPPPVR